ncbi:MAG: peptidoglycan DD-metalloendopeptidase family protein [Gallionella sp.]|nr:peptidoglycan DD-metalloendopeptidase family protein [Gallionella sp.]
MRSKSFWMLLLVSAIFAGCSSQEYRAPVFDTAEAQKSEATAQSKKPLREKDWRPRTYTVQKGDTLYSIAFNYGFDYHELADLNGIKNPRKIMIGQVIRLFPGKTASAARAASAAESLIKDQPKLVKYPYSEAAMAQIEKVQEQTTPVVTKIAKADDTEPDNTIDESEEAALEWTLPAQGKLIAQFSESANRKGIDIAGTLGQPVVAGASGKVVYSGSGLRGYGKLIIIKHNKTYLSAYAHNDKILVKEGQAVTRGQKIAAMGKTDTDKVKLHFEVRRLGKPVDPAKYLPMGKS